MATISPDTGNILPDSVEECGQRILEIEERLEDPEVSTKSGLVDMFNEELDELRKHRETLLAQTVEHKQVLGWEMVEDNLNQGKDDFIPPPPDFFLDDSSEEDLDEEDFELLKDSEDIEVDDCGEDE